MNFANPRDRALSDDISLYRDQQTTQHRYPPLTQSADTDICIVGAGFTGLMTAKYLREKGYNVIVIERHRVGWGASGRCAGFLIPSFNKDIRQVIGKIGLDAATTYYKATVAAMEELKTRIHAENIPAEYTGGQIIPACTPWAAHDLSDYRTFIRDNCDYQMFYLDKMATQNALGTSLYHGALVDENAGRMNPLAYVTHLGESLHKAGVTLHEETPALSVRYEAGKVVVTTPQGDVTAKKLVAAGDAYQGWLLPELRRKYILMRTSMLATSVLPQDILDSVIPAGKAVFEWRTVLNYYTKTHDGRLVFGGGDSTLSRSDAQRNKQFKNLARSMTRLFPQLNESYIGHYWSGYISSTIGQTPNFGTIGDKIYYAGSYAGHGIVPSHMAGRVLAEAIDGNDAMLKLLQTLHEKDIPGAGHMDNGIVALALCWHKLKDRFF